MNTIAMGGLPLALDQAGAYIEARQCCLSDYLDLYRGHREALLQERGGPIIGHPDAVATTWSLSFQRVEQTNPGAAELLRFCAFLSPDAIPEELLIKKAAHCNSPLQALAASPLLLNDAISALLAYSLVRRNPRQKTLSVHRLVQAVLQSGLQEEAKRPWAERVVFAVNATFPEVEHRTWPLCERLLPHALLAVQYLEQYQMPGEEAGRLLSVTASYLQGRVRYQEAEPLYRRSLALVEQWSGSEHPAVAASLNRLANLYREQGRYAEAEPFFRQALRIQEQSGGLQHADTAEIMEGLARLQEVQGKSEEAREWYARALGVREQALGMHHPKTTEARQRLLIFLHSMGQHEEATRFEVAQAEEGLVAEE